MGRKAVKKRGIFGKHTDVVITGIFGVIAAIVTGYLSHQGSAPNGRETPPAPAVHINPSTAVARCADITGEGTHSDEHWTTWVAVGGEDLTRSPSVIHPVDWIDDGHWRANVAFGDAPDGGAKFTVQAFEMPTESTDFLKGLRGFGQAGDEGYPAVTVLPPDARSVARQIFTRKPGTDPHSDCG